MNVTVRTPRVKQFLPSYLPWVILFVSWLLKVEKMHSLAARVRVCSSRGHLFFLYLGGVFLVRWLLPPPVSSVLCDSDSWYFLIIKLAVCAL